MEIQETLPQISPKILSPAFFQNIKEKTQAILISYGSVEEWIILIIAFLLMALVIPKIFPKKNSLGNKKSFLSENPGWTNISNFFVYIFLWLGVIYLRSIQKNFQILNIQNFFKDMDIPTGLIFCTIYFLIAVFISLFSIIIASQIITFLRILFLIFLPATSIGLSYLFFSEHSIVILSAVNLLVLIVSMVIYTEFSGNFQEISSLTCESSKIISRNFIPILTVILATLSILIAKLIIIIPLIGHKNYYFISIIPIYMILSWSVNLMIGFNKVFISTIVIENKRGNSSLSSNIKKAFHNAIQSIGTISYLSMVSAVILGFQSILTKIIEFLESAKDTGSAVSMFYNSFRILLIWTLKIIRYVINIYTRFIKAKTEVNLAYLSIYGNRKSLCDDADSYYCTRSELSGLMRSVVPIFRTLTSYLSLVVFTSLQFFTGDIDVYSVISDVINIKLMKIDGSLLNVRSFTFFASIYVIYVIVTSTYTATIAIDAYNRDAISSKLNSSYNEIDLSSYETHEGTNGGKSKTYGDRNKTYGGKSKTYGGKNKIRSRNRTYNVRNMAVIPKNQINKKSGFFKQSYQ